MDPLRHSREGLQFIIPAGFLFAGLASFIKRHQARVLLTQAQAASGLAISTMTWSQFERLIGESFRRRGYKVAETGGGGSDGGVDLHLTKEGKSFLVQCKHWRTQRVGVSIVRALNGAIAAPHGFVVISGHFTAEAWHFAKSCEVELIDGDRLAPLLRQQCTATPDSFCWASISSNSARTTVRDGSIGPMTDSNT